MTAKIDRETGGIVGLVMLLCLLTVGSVVGAAAAAPAHTAVTGVSVSEEDPETGDRIIITPTISHSGSGSGSFEVTEVTVEDSSGTKHSEANQIGVLGAGDTAEVPVSARFDTAGDKRLTVHVRGRYYDSDGATSEIVHLKHPVFVTVSEPSTSTTVPPRVHIETHNAVAETDTTVTVTVSNGDDEALTDLSLRLDSVDGEMQSRTAITPVLAAENSTTYEFTVEPSEAGETALKATLRYNDGESVEAFDTVQVESLRDDVSVYATAFEENDTVSVRYRVTNHGNAPIDDVVISGVSNESQLPTTSLQSVDAATSKTVVVDVNERPSSTATVAATYDIGETTGQATQSVQFDSSAASTGTNALTVNLGSVDPSNTSTFLLSGFFGGLVVTALLFTGRRWVRDD
ncbi:S-layer domain [Haloferax volcanii]|nr:S-layer domain [Haloferax lucentense]